MASILIQKQQTSDHWLKYSTDINQEATGRELMSVSKTVTSSYSIIKYTIHGHQQHCSQISLHVCHVLEGLCVECQYVCTFLSACPECAIIITQTFFCFSFFTLFSDLMHSYKSITHTNNNFITLAVVVTAAPLCFLTNTKGPGKPPDELRLSAYHLPRSVSTSWLNKKKCKKKMIQCGKGRKQSGYNRRVWLSKAVVWFTACSLWTPE